MPGPLYRMEYQSLSYFNATGFEELSHIWNELAIQVNPLNAVMAMSGNTFNKLGLGGQQFFIARYKTAFPNIPTEGGVSFVVDTTHKSRYLLGPSTFPAQYPIPDINGEPIFLPVVIAPDEEYKVPTTSDTPGQLSANPRIANQTKPIKIRRPPNAFILYRARHQKEVKATNPGIHNNDISVILGKAWAGESDAIRSHYAGLANAIRDEFMMRYPNYQFKPRRSSQIRRRARHGNGSSSSNGGGNSTTTPAANSNTTTTNTLGVQLANGAQFTFGGTVAQREMQVRSLVVAVASAFKATDPTEAAEPVSNGTLANAAVPGAPTTGAISMPSISFGAGNPVQTFTHIDSE